jgi:hypothetical protein
LWGITFAVTDLTKRKLTKRSTKLKIEKAAINSVHERYAWDVVKLVPPDVSLDTLDIQDSIVHSTPCNMCGGEVGSRCAWICCGHVAYIDCAWLQYARVVPSGVCPRCLRVFSPGWSVEDMLAAPPMDVKNIKNADVQSLRQKKKTEKKKLNVSFQRT